jgi:hypothetical protein
MYLTLSEGELVQITNLKDVVKAYKARFAVKGFSEKDFTVGQERQV